MAIEDFDLQKTITFSEALSRTKDLYPQIGGWEKQLKQLQLARNDIVHYGSDQAKEDDYAYLAAAIALPFLAEFLSYSNGIDLGKVVGKNVYREVEVAIEVCRQMQIQGRTSYARALRTVQCALLYRDVAPQVAYSRDALAEASYFHQQALAESLGHRLTWSGRVLEVWCKICGSIDAFVEVDADEDEEVIGLFPVSVACAQCSLNITRADAPLPQLHFGALLRSDITAGLD